MHVTHDEDRYDLRNQSLSSSLDNFDGIFHDVTVNTTVSDQHRAPAHNPGQRHRQVRRESQPQVMTPSPLHSEAAVQAQAKIAHLTMTHPNDITEMPCG